MLVFTTCICSRNQVSVGILTFIVPMLKGEGILKYKTHVCST